MSTAPLLHGHHSQNRETPNSKSPSNCNARSHPMYDTAEYDSLSFEDRDEIDQQNHEMALAILLAGNDL